MYLKRLDLLPKHARLEEELFMLKLNATVARMNSGSSLARVPGSGVILWARGQAGIGSVTPKYGKTITATAALVRWTPKIEPVLMRASQAARLGQEKPHETQAPHTRADHSQAAHR